MTAYNRATNEAIDNLGSISIYFISGKSFDEAIDALKREKEQFMKDYCDPNKPKVIYRSGSKDKAVFTRLFIEAESYSESTAYNVMGVRPISPAELAKLNADEEQRKDYRRKQYESLRKEFEQTKP